MEKPNFLLDRMKQNVEKMIDIATKKNKDYSGAMPFQNFMLVEHLGAADSETGILVRMCDKVSRISNLLKSDAPAVRDESIHDTLLDLANYALILDALIAYKAGADKVKAALLNPDAGWFNAEQMAVLTTLEHAGDWCRFKYAGRDLRGLITVSPKGVVQITNISDPDSKGCALDALPIITPDGYVSSCISDLKIEIQ